ncbi:thioredoxin-like protein [Hortaea werneckii]|nr:thioredoxin-like protein [Hortaea werneckii]
MASIKSVQVGKPAPDFNCTAVVDGRLKEVTLTSYTQANHWLILIFFPKAFSFICPTEIKAFSARLEEFLYSRSCAVVFASTDSEHCLKAWNATGDMEGGLGGVHVPLISDCNHRLSRDYGVLIEEEGVAQRALFIIDPKGVVRSITVNDADVGRSVDEAQRVLDALKFKDEFGEGCPVDWKKGDAGINTTTPLEGKLELKKSWSEWARPKLQRAWSGTSARSSHGAAPSLMTLGNVAGNGPASPVPNMSPHHASLTKLNREGFASVESLGALMSPTTPNRLESDMDEAMLAQRMENMKAAMANSGTSVGIAS